jgi:hypothetical protein
VSNTYSFAVHLIRVSIRYGVNPYYSRYLVNDKIIRYDYFNMHCLYNAHKIMNCLGIFMNGLWIYDLLAQRIGPLASDPKYLGTLSLLFAQF